MRLFTEDFYFVGSQKPLDIKGWFKDLEDMKNPGNEKYSRFYYYYSGMPAHDMSTGEIYIWRERLDGETTEGVLEQDFIYSDGYREDEYFNYTSKAFNFFPLIRIDTLYESIEVTYSELINLINNSELKSSQTYKITDFRTTYTFKDYFTTTTKYGENEILFVSAISKNNISSIAVSLAHPNDLIIYDVTQNKIIYREDVINKIIAYFDFRAIQTVLYAPNVTEYSVSDTYTANQLVSYNDDVYKVLIDTTAGIPVTNRSYFILFPIIKDKKYIATDSTYWFLDQNSGVENLAIVNSSFIEVDMGTDEFDYYIESSKDLKLIDVEKVQIVNSDKLNLVDCSNVVINNSTNTFVISGVSSILNNTENSKILDSSIIANKLESCNIDSSSNLNIGVLKDSTIIDCSSLLIQNIENLNLYSITDTIFTYTLQFVNNVTNVIFSNQADDIVNLTCFTENKSLEIPTETTAIYSIFTRQIVQRNDNSCMLEYQDDNNDTVFFNLTIN